jgi:hypothetical protein
MILAVANSANTSNVIQTIGLAFVVIAAVWKVSRQLGRIEYGVKGLYARVERLEKKERKRVKKYYERSK